ncbi:MAG: AsnC family transcriptional regulator [Candidatus Hecatellales archaeon]|nr:MAG: AsnC family transcriptional regulator [Candidatus Hecatellales archaeon]RLI33228.1 MAG: AsnC family transcriptional regulator [Candidatus Bathyarchaeota archaeon]
MDELDLKILGELLRDGRQSFREIARNLGIATGTVLTRIKNLERQGVIKGYTAILDHEKLGYELTVVVEITVSKGKLLEVDREIAKKPNVCAVYDVTGLTDAIVVAKFKNREELSKFTKSLLSIPHVERTNTHLVLTTIKEDFRLT